MVSKNPEETPEATVSLRKSDVEYVYSNCESLLDNGWMLRTSYRFSKVVDSEAQDDNVKRLHGAVKQTIEDFGVPQIGSRIYCDVIGGRVDFCAFSCYVDKYKKKVGAPVKNLHITMSEIE